MGRFAKKKGIDGKPIRWFSDHDSSSHNINYRYARMILCDFVVVLQNASPYQNNNICFWDSLADVFTKLSSLWRQLATFSGTSICSWHSLIVKHTIWGYEMPEPSSSEVARLELHVGMPEPSL